MTLYHHFPNKDAILDGVSETILDTMTLPEPLPEDGMDLLVSMCMAFRRTLAAHPNAMPVLIPARSTPRRGVTVTPVGVLQERGFDPGAMLEMYQSLMALTFGHAVVSTVTRRDATGRPGDCRRRIRRAIRILIEASRTREPGRRIGRLAGRVELLAQSSDRPKHRRVGLGRDRREQNDALSRPLTARSPLTGHLVRTRALEQQGRQQRGAPLIQLASGRQHRQKPLGGQGIDQSGLPPAMSSKISSIISSGSAVRPSRIESSIRRSTAPSNSI